MRGSARPRPIHYLVRFVAAARDHKPAFALKRALRVLTPDIRQTHLVVMCLVVSETSRTGPDDPEKTERRRARLQRMTSDLEITEVVDDTDSTLDALAEIDEWKTSRDSFAMWLHEGGHCFVARRDGQLIAAIWLTSGTSFAERHLGRDFHLAPHESYVWAAHCVPGRRGQGVMPRLIDFAMSTLASRSGKREFVMLVRPSNHLSIRTAEKIGFRRVGRAGFVEASGRRFHYLLGRRAFPNTGRRLFFTRTD